MPCSCTPETKSGFCPLHQQAEALLRLVERFVNAPHLNCWNQKLCGQPFQCPYCEAVHLVADLSWRKA